MSVTPEPNRCEGCGSPLPSDTRDTICDPCWQAYERQIDAELAKEYDREMKRQVWIEEVRRDVYGEP